MREIERIDRILDLIKELWMLDPDLRFLQMMWNLQAGYSRDNNGEGLIEYEVLENGVPYKYQYSDLFHLEDDKLEKYLVALIESKRKNK